VPKSTSTSKAH